MNGQIPPSTDNAPWPLSSATWVSKAERERKAEGEGGEELQWAG